MGHSINANNRIYGEITHPHFQKEISAGLDAALGRREVLVTPMWCGVKGEIIAWNLEYWRSKMNTQPYGKPVHRGKEVIKELVATSKGFGNDYQPTDKAIYFNLEGYGVLCKQCKTPALLILDYDEKGKLAAFNSHRKQWRKLIKYDDSVEAERIINMLYTDPYYHSHFKYLEMVKDLRDMFSQKYVLSQTPTSIMKLKFKEIHDQAEFCLNQMEMASREFGQAGPYLVVKHRPYKAMNFYLVNFENKAWTIKKKTKYQYSTDDEPQYIYEYELTNLPEDAFYLRETIFGLQMGTSTQVFDSIENKILPLLDRLIPKPDNILPAIQALTRLVFHRKLFSEPQQKIEFLNKVNALSNKDLEVIKKEFIALYIQAHKDAGRYIDDTVDDIFGSL